MPGKNVGTFSDNVGRLNRKGLNAKNGKQAVAVAYSEAERGDGPKPKKKIEGMDCAIGHAGAVFYHAGRARQIEGLPFPAEKRNRAATAEPTATLAAGYAGYHMDGSRCSCDPACGGLSYMPVKDEILPGYAFKAATPKADWNHAGKTLAVLHHAAGQPKASKPIYDNAQQSVGVHMFTANSDEDAKAQQNAIRHVMTAGGFTHHRSKDTSHYTHPTNKVSVYVGDSKPRDGGPGFPVRVAMGNDGVPAAGPLDGISPTGTPAGV